jgi:hypothetical protein
MTSSAHLTTPIIWNCTIILAIMESGLVLLAWRLVHRELFNAIRVPLILTSGAFFLLVWTSVLIWAWDWFYAYIFPTWARFALPPIFSLGYALVAAGMAWLSLKLKGSPAVTWSVLGGLERLLSHLYAICGLGAASKPPIMQGTNLFAVLVFAIFEKGFYWSIILLASSYLSKRIFRKYIWIPGRPFA